MNDEKLLKIIELLDAECLCQDQGRMTGSGRAASLKKCQRKTDICLQLWDNEMLNDLVIMVKVGKYNDLWNDDNWKKIQRKMSFDNLEGWRNEIGAERLSDDQCLKYLRKWSASTLIKDICSYITMKPMGNRQKELLRGINKDMISNRMKHTQIETR